MVIVIMGVSGVGKSLIGQTLAQDLGWDFHDADDFQPLSNLEKMRAGVPLDDADRLPWLAALRQFVETCLREGRNAVLAASLLKAAYRETIGIDDDRVRLVFLHADPALIRKRLECRQGHFMRAEMLDSQFAILEVPRAGLSIDASLPDGEIVKAIRRGLSL